MSNTNLLPLLLSSAIVSFVCYKCFCKDDTIEHWWDLSVPLTTTSEIVGPDGQAVSGNNQENLTYDTNSIINSSFFNKEQVKNSYTQYKKEQSEEGFCSSCDGGDEKKGSGFYTVPGNYQPYLSPRMNSAGLNSYVRYQLPDEKYQANKPNDPFTVAEYFDKPNVKENFQNVGNKIVDSTKVEGNGLPVSGDMKNVGAVAGQAKDGFYVNTERLIFSTAKNRLRGQGDPIRGDLPVIPCNPEANPNSNVWFRPSANPQSMLNGGAMNVLGGTGNTTAMQLAQLMSNSNGGQNTTYGGLAFTPPGTSMVGQAVAATDKTMNVGSQTTQSAQRASGSNPTVVASAFP
jgi:hypothetical protein